MISVIQCGWLYSIIQWPTGDTRSSKSTKRGKGFTNLSIGMEMSFRLGTPRVKTLNVCVDDEFKNIGWTCFIDSLFVTSQLICWLLPVIHRVFIGWFAYGSKCCSNNCKHDHVFKKIHPKSFIHKLMQPSRGASVWTSISWSQTTINCHASPAIHGSWQHRSSPLHSIVTSYNICLEYLKETSKKRSQTFKTSIIHLNEYFKNDWP